ncbi:MAG: hypothetical protein Q7U74_04590 [Saprospiraceae bacterium]|nr:hypothetical protein [Saprospiraceae bacterium]
MSGLMAFMLEEKAEGFRPVMGVVGIFLSIYTGYMIQQYGMHVRTGWNVTDFLRTKIEGLEEVWEHRAAKAEGYAQGLPGFARPLLGLAVGYGLVFGGLAVWFWVKG